jgi:hypothetical protein
MNTSAAIADLFLWEMELLVSSFRFHIVRTT